MLKNILYHLDLVKINGGHFVRCENVSLKYGKHGCIQYTNIKQIFESMLTSPIGHSPINVDIEELNIYLIQWTNINKFKEFRVFVHDNKITAISQQHFYQSNELLKVLSNDDKSKIINEWIILIQNYFNSNIKNNILLNSYCYDFAILDNNKPYFIEINPFGKEYSSGSALFHWLNDENKLYGIDDKIYFRYTS
jgi:hypothetical protein